jgi:flagellar basal-body rod protein FlgG
MINSLWISKTGMEAQQMQLDVISNNLANVSTTGFKRASAMFEDLMYQNLRQVGSNNTEQSQLPTGLQVGLGVRTVGTSRSFEQGGLQQTGNPLDVAISDGKGFFQVTMPDGTINYTRNGSFKSDATGRLVTSSGLPIVPGVTVPVGAAPGSITVSNTGVVEAVVGGTKTSIGTITLASFINPAGLEPKGQNLFAESAASGTPNAGTPGTDGLGTLMQGYVETSNVNVVQELVTMIQTQRAYEMNSKAIQTSDQMLQKLGQI